MRQPGDIYKDPKDGIYRKVIKLGPVLGVEVMHGYVPPWTPKERNPLELSPVVQKFLLWRFQPVERPKAGTLTGRQKDRLLRMALRQKRTNFYPTAGTWKNWREKGLTDAMLMHVINKEFGCSTHASKDDKRRAFVDYYRKGKKAVFVIGAEDDPDRYVLEGAELLCAVRRTMNIKRIC